MLVLLITIKSPFHLMSMAQSFKYPTFYAHLHQVVYPGSISMFPMGRRAHVFTMTDILVQDGPIFAGNPHAK